MEFFESGSAEVPASVVAVSPLKGFKRDWSDMLQKAMKELLKSMQSN